MPPSSDDDFTGRVFNVQRFSVHDGPGIRTTLFLKGCPLRCYWCDNPESRQSKPQIVFWRDRCIECNTCVTVCPHAAIIVNTDGHKQVQTEQCDLCGRCIEECYAGALEQIGRAMTVAQAITLIEEDRAFYDQSGGGVTLSGGEALNQPEFSRRILAGCHARGIHTAIETSGYASWSTWQSLLPHLDLILFDLKEVESTQHQRGTGVPSKLILDNLRQLANTGKPIIVRRPVIPGFNDSPESIHVLANFLRELGSIQEINLLPYHRFGRGKYERLELEYPMGDLPSLPEEAVTKLQDLLVAYGFCVKIGG